MAPTFEQKLRRVAVWMIRTAAVYHEISKPARHPAATPPPLPSGGAGNMPSSLPDAVRRRAERTKQVARERKAATNMAARKFKKDADAAQTLKDMGRPHLPRHAAPQSTQTGKPVPTALPEAQPLRELVLDQHHLDARPGAWWTPSRLSMTDSSCTEERAVYGVRYEDTELMLKWLAPPLASAFGHLIASRKGREAAT